MQINLRPTLTNIGGKAYQLYRLKECCNIPPFFVISFKDPHEIHDPVVQRTILQQCQAQRFDLMAVRSSASCEDSAYASFAGMFETVLKVRPPDVIDAISRVLTSVHSKRVADYCRARELDKNKIRMAVIVQRMVPSRVSGVCFTRMQEGRNSLIVEACYGLGEALVSGKVNPDSYILDRKTLAVERESIGYQTIMLNPHRDRGCGAVYEPVPFHRRNARKLTYDEITTVAKTCLVVEQHLSFEAADVEWAFEEHVLHILQARPYSAFHR